MEEGNRTTDNFKIRHPAPQVTTSVKTESQQTKRACPNGALQHHVKPAARSSLQCALFWGGMPLYSPFGLSFGHQGAAIPHRLTHREVPRPQRT